MAAFKPEAKEETTEKSQELKLKKGGHAVHKAMGGAMPVRPTIPVRGAPVMQPVGHPMAGRGRPMVMPQATGLPTAMKHGGKAEHKEHHKAHGGLLIITPKEMAGAGKPHKKAGGAIDQSMRMGREAQKHGDEKTVTGGAEPEFKKGGKAHHKDGGGVKPFEETKMVPAKQEKSISSKTGEDEKEGGFKKGGHAKKHHYAKGGGVEKFAETKVIGAESPKTVKKGTGEIKQDPAGYKHGGHVKMSTIGHGEHGHTNMFKKTKEHDGHKKEDGHPYKKGGSCRF